MGSLKWLNMNMNIIVKASRYSGTYAHKYFDFEERFASLQAELASQMEADDKLNKRIKSNLNAL
jgi:hypothetical protein